MDLISDFYHSNSAIRFGYILIPLLLNDSGGILKYTDELHFL